MRYYFYDLGAFNGAESAAMALIFADLGITDYHIYMFEPSFEAFNALQKRFEKTDVKRTILPLAIADQNVNLQLYHSFRGNEAGHSIFASKSNVNPENSETVVAVKFSDWLRQNVQDFESAVNILKFNIEGAEWHLVQDMTANNLWPHFQVICGDYEDVLKVAELHDQAEEHFERIRQHRVHIFQFSGQAGVVPAHERNLMKAALSSVLT